MNSYIQDGLSIVRWTRYEETFAEDAIVEKVILHGMYKRALLRRGIALLICGFSANEMGRLIGITKTTAMKLRRRVMKATELKCGCGESAGHRGWCKWRLARSAKRALILAQMHKRQIGRKP